MADNIDIFYKPEFVIHALETATLSTAEELNDKKTHLNKLQCPCCIR